MRASLLIVYIDTTITVSGGTGSANIRHIGEIHRIGVVPPGASAYDMDISDGDGFGVCGSRNNIGTTTMTVDQPITGLSVLTISNAGNGVYKCRLAISSGI